VTVGCVTTVDDTLLIRQNGRVAVIGNCPGAGVIAAKPSIVQRALALAGGVGDDMGGEFADQALVALSTGNALGVAYERLAIGGGVFPHNLAAISAKLDTLLARPSEVTDEQFEALAERFAAETDKQTIKQALAEFYTAGIAGIGS
jgi:protein involved in polysaccharide export with SLBB domain